MECEESDNPKGYERIRAGQIDVTLRQRVDAKVG